MSADASVTLSWRDGENVFRLGLREIRIVQEKTGYGPLHILRRLQSGEAFIDEWRETIRQGLIGGGMSSKDTDAALKRSVDDSDMAQSILLAHAILSTAVAGVQDDRVGESSGAGDANPAPTTTSEAGSSSQESMAPALQ